MKRKRISWDGGAADVSTENNGRSKLEYAGPAERWSIDFVHETLADGPAVSDLDSRRYLELAESRPGGGGDGRDGQLDVRSRPERRPAFQSGALEERAYRRAV